jgi:hypothetical protein
MELPTSFTCEFCHVKRYSHKMIQPVKSMFESKRDTETLPLFWTVLFPHSSISNPQQQQQHPPIDFLKIIGNMNCATMIVDENLSKDPIYSQIAAMEQSYYEKHFGVKIVSKRPGNAIVSGIAGPTTPSLF